MWQSMLKPAAVAALINSAPKIMETARKFYADLKERHRPQDAAAADADLEISPGLRKRFADLEQRLATLETDESVQAELVSQMAAQEEALSRGLRALSMRVTLLLWVSVGAALVAVTAIVIAVQ